MKGDRWYYRCRGSEMGPVTIAQIEKLIAGGLLGDFDAVRSNGGDWLSLKEFANSHSTAASQQSDYSDEIRQASKDAVQQISARAGKPKTPKETRSSLVEGMELRRILSLPVGIVQGITGTAIELAARIPRFIWTGTAIVVLLGFGGHFAWKHYDSKDAEIVSVECIWQEYVMLREDGTTTTQIWDEFRNSAIPNLSASTSQLETHGSMDDQTKRELLWVARDFLPQLIKLAPETNSKTEANCRQLMSRLHTDTMRARRNRRNRLDPATTGILIFDGMLICFGCVWFYRSR